MKSQQFTIYTRDGRRLTTLARSAGQCIVNFLYDSYKEGTCTAILKIENEAGEEFRKIDISIKMEVTTYVK